MFHIDVAKVDRVCICCNGYTLILQVSIPNVTPIFSDVCCKCVYLDVASVLSGCCVCFTMVFRCFCKCFRCMFQVFHLDVLKVDRVLHPPPRLLLPCLGVSSSRCRLGIQTRGTGGHCPLPLFSMLVMFEVVRALRGACESECEGGCSDTSTADF